MDYLDPRKKQAYKVRLIIGYVLISIAIALAALVLLYNAYGYTISTKTGQIIEDGLVFIQSQPGGATIYLNGVKNSTTSARLVLPAGNYTLKLTKSGYRPWQREISIDEHEIARYVYPFLFPLKPVTTTLQTYTTQPALVTQTPDYHWLLVESAATTDNQFNFDEYDTTKPTTPAVSLSLPNSILTNPTVAGGSLSVVEWSTDNDHVLLEHSYPGGSEYIVFDRGNPAASFNVNTMFNIVPSSVALRNKSTSQLYIYDATAQTLQVGNTSTSTLDPVFLKHVLAFKAYGSSLITYVTQNGMPAGLAQARIWDNGPTYPLYNFTAGSHYIIDAAQYAGDFYYIAGSNTDDRVDIFENPLNDITNPAVGEAVPILALRVLGATSESFSTNARFVEIENGQNLAVYDFEFQNRYQYTLKDPLAGPLTWMDGHRLMGESNGSFFVTDYDGTNQQLLVPTDEADGGHFSANYNQLFTLEPVAGSASVELDNVDMLAGADLPKSS
jgi:hypothetical protein